MEYITLQNTDLSVSRLCMGGCPMGRHGWGNVLESELIAAVHTALDLGIQFFDTADVYGLGASERTLGKALGSLKCGMSITLYTLERLCNVLDCQAESIVLFLPDNDKS